MKVIKIFNGINIAFVLFVAINIILQFMPITNVLGYDFAALNGILQSILGAFIANKFIKDAPSFSFLKIKQNLIYLFLVPILPLFISAISTIFVAKCPLCLGISFYFVITIPAFLIGISLAIISNYLLEKRTSILLFLIYLVIIISPIVEIFFNPQIYFYNPLVGFFPGTIYDEDISVTSQHLWYMFLIALFIGSILFYIKKNWKQKRTSRGVCLLYSILIFITFAFLKPRLGFATDLIRIDSILGKVKKTEHFTIYYSQKTSAEKINVIAAEHEFYYSKLSEYLKIKPKRITSILFETREQKGKIFGAENADVAKPWLSQIYLDIGSYQNTLKHELIHIFSAEIGVTPFKLAKNFNPALIEGFAVAIENNYAEFPIDYIAKTAFESGFKIDINNLFSGFNFFGNLAGLSYIYSGSFIKFLIETYGIEKVKTLYGSIEFEKIFGKPIQQLSEEYYKYLTSYNAPFNKNLAKLYFGRKPLIKKICARYAAERLKEASKAFKAKDYKESEEIYTEIFSKTEQFNAFRGLVASYARQNKITQAEELLRKYQNKYDSTAYQFSYKITYADVLIKQGNFSKAEEFYQKVYDAPPTEDYKNFAFTWILLLKTNYKIALKYLNGSPYDRYKILQNLSKNDILYRTVPLQINLSEVLRENFDDFISRLNNNYKVTNSESFYGAVEIAKYAFAKGNMEVAANFIGKAINFSAPNYIKHQAKELNEKINWSRSYLCSQDK